MSSEEQKPKIDIKVDKNGFYRDEAFTDLKVASIRRLLPVKSDGTVDESREPMFIGHTQVMTPQGPVPIQCGIEAKTLEEAMDKFPEAVNKALENIIEEAKEIKRQQDSRIVVPGQDEGGKIHMP